MHIVVLAAAAGLGPGHAVAEGDSAYAHRDLAAARSRYEAALSAPDSFPALWRLARVESEMGEDAKGKEQQELIGSSVLHARAAVRVAPDSALGHEWLAVTLGRKALKEGAKKKLALAREIKSEVDRALALNPQSARAYHVRAWWSAWRPTPCSAACRRAHRWRTRCTTSSARSSSIPATSTIIWSWAGPGFSSIARTMRAASWSARSRWPPAPRRATRATLRRRARCSPACPAAPTGIPCHADRARKDRARLPITTMNHSTD
jgi:regulator of microtubule dynamics RMD1/3-like protein